MARLFQLKVLITVNLLHVRGFTLNEKKKKKKKKKKKEIETK